MGYQTTFKRYEIKYLLTRQQKKQILEAMSEYMKLDNYGRTTIRNIYYDTDSYRLIRRSMEKPAYKEKLRVRSYTPVAPSEPVFVELKKKYKSIVYKRRLTLPEEQVTTCFALGESLPVHSQIGEEIDYFRSYYGSLHPAVFLSYEREAYYALDGSDFRVTFDENILFREKDFFLGSRIYGTPIISDTQTLLEIKTSGGIPLWMVHVLSDNHIYKTSFSKYGTAYRKIFERQHLRVTEDVQKPKINKTLQRRLAYA